MEIHFLTVPEAGVQDQGSRWLGFWLRNLFLASRQPPSFHGLTWSVLGVCTGSEGESQLSRVSSYRDSHPIRSGLRPYDIIQPNDFLRGLSPETATLEVSISTTNGGHKHWVRNRSPLWQSYQVASASDGCQTRGEEALLLFSPQEYREHEASQANFRSAFSSPWVWTTHSSLYAVSSQIPDLCTHRLSFLNILVFKFIPTYLGIFLCVLIF